MTGIVIVNYNTFEDLKVCIASIKHNVYENYKIYIVDNASTDNSIDSMVKCFADDISIVIIQTKENLGYSGGNNIGIRQAVQEGADHILIVNPDVELKNDVIGIMKRAMEDDSITVAAPKIEDINGDDGQRIRKCYNFKYALFDKKPFYYLRRVFLADVRYKYNTNKSFVFYGFPSGCCFLIKTETLKKIDYFDENVFLYSEEHILGKKLQALGEKCVYVPKAFVYHKEGSSTKKISNAFIDYHLYVSEYYLLNRYCHLNKVKLAIIKNLRIFAFFVKTKFDKSYYKRYQMLKTTFHEIEQGNFKISY